MLAPNVRKHRAGLHSAEYLFNTQRIKLSSTSKEKISKNMIENLVPLCHTDNASKSI